MFEYSFLGRYCQVDIAASVKKRYTHDEVMTELRKIVSEKETPKKRRRG